MGPKNRRRKTVGEPTGDGQRPLRASDTRLLRRGWRVLLDMVRRPVAVCVGLRQRRGVLPREGRVRRDEALLHPFLLLHPPVLEPYLDLGLVQLEGGCDLDPPCPCQVFVEVELLLQLGQLLRRKVGPPCVVDAASLATEIPVGLGS